MEQYNDELYHFGVKGMKWGHHTYAQYQTSRANAAIKRMNKSKTRLGKAINNNIAYQHEVNANVANSMKNDKGIRKKVGNIYGHGAAASIQNAASNYYERKASYTKTRLGTKQAQAAAYNNKTAAKANQKIHDSKTLSARGKATVDGMMNRSIKTWSGRTTTTGKQVVDSILTGGAGSAIKDVAYYNKTTKAAKQQYKAEKKKADNAYKSAAEKMDKSDTNVAGHKALAKTYAINEKAYAKSNKTLSSMNKAAKEKQLDLAKKAQANNDAFEKAADQWAVDRKKARQKYRQA